MRKMTWAEGSDADKAARQNMEKEAAQKLLGGEGHLSLLIMVCIILPAEGDLIMLEGHKAWLVMATRWYSEPDNPAHDGDTPKGGLA